MTVRVYLAPWVLPISSPAIPTGAVAVADGCIAYVGPAAHAPPGETIDVGRAVLLPGLVNAHSHLELTAFRGLVGEMPFRRWILRLTEMRDAVMTAERHLSSARVGIAEGLLSGTTAYADCTAAGHVLDAMGSMGVRGIVYQEVFGPDPTKAEAALQELVEKVNGLRARQVPHVIVGVSPHAPFTVSDALFRAVGRFARERELPIAVHVAESDAEYALVSDGAGDFADGLRARGIDAGARASTPVALMNDVEILGPHTLLIHAIRVSRDDLFMIRDTGCGVAHCPASNAKLGHGIAPLQDMLEMGLPVGLGSDSMASNDRMDMLEEARLAVLQQRALTRRHDVVSAESAVRLATMGGARALGLHAQVGSLEVGKQADLAAFPIDAADCDAESPPFEALVHGMAGRRASLTVVAGRELVRHGELVMDLRADRTIVAETAGALRQAAR